MTARHFSPLSVIRGITNHHTRRGAVARTAVAISVATVQASRAAGDVAVQSDVLRACPAGRPASSTSPPPCLADRSLRRSRPRARIGTMRRVELRSPGKRSGAIARGVHDGASYRVLVPDAARDAAAR